MPLLDPISAALFPSIGASMAPLGHATPARTLLGRISELGLQGVAIDATHPELRPRNLDRSARRDLASMLRRLELRPVAIDLWLPTRHFADPARADRAIAAATDACGFAVEIASLTDGRPLVCMNLPRGGPEQSDAVEAIAAEATRTGCRIADFAHRAADDLPVGESPIGVGMDPAAVFIAEGDGTDLAAWAAKCKGMILDARLTDATDNSRVRPGNGNLDVLAYPVALQAAGYEGPLTIDPRGRPAPMDELASLAEEFRRDPAARTMSP